MGLLAGKTAMHKQSEEKAERYSNDVQYESDDAWASTTQLTSRKTLVKSKLIGPSDGLDGLEPMLVKLEIS